MSEEFLLITHYSLLVAHCSPPQLFFAYIRVTPKE